MKYLAYIVLLLLLSACSSLQVETDYNPEFNFGSLSSYTVVHKMRADEDALKNGRIIRALEENLDAKGYVQRPKEEADFYVLFHTQVRTRTQIDTDYEFVGLYPYYWYGFYRPMELRTTRVSTYDEEKLIVDAVIPDGNRIIWRGVATDWMPSFDTPEERIAYVNEVIASLLKSFPAKNAPEKKMR